MKIDTVSVPMPVTSRTVALDVGQLVHPSVAADELGDPVGLDQGLDLLEVGGLDHPLAGLLGPAALLGHLGVEAGPVDGVAPLGHHLLGDLEGEAVGVVEQEGHLARQLAAGRHIGQRSSRMDGAGGQGLAELGLLPLDHRADEVVGGDQLGVVGPHDLDHGVDQAGGDEIGRPRAGRRSGWPGA